MNKQEIYKCLEEYRVNRARLAMLKSAAEVKDCRLDELNQVSGLKQSRSSLAPSGRTNKVSTPVQDEVDKRSEKWAEIEQIKQELESIHKEINELIYKTKMVENWLSALNDEERFVVEKRYFHGNDWGVIVIEFAEVFRKNWVSESTIYRRNGTALSKIRMITEKV